MKKEQLKNKAFIKAIILRNLKLSIDYAIDKLIEDAEANEKFESPELSEDFFNIQARGDFNITLLSQISDNTKQTIFLAKQM